MTLRKIFAAEVMGPKSSTQCLDLIIIPFIQNPGLMRIVHGYECSHGLFQHLYGLCTWNEGGGNTDLPARPRRPGERPTHGRQGKPPQVIEEQVGKKSCRHKRKGNRVVEPIPKRKPIEEKIGKNSYHRNGKHGED